MAHHKNTTLGGLTLIITDMCFHCGGEPAQPEDAAPGDAFQCEKCGGWVEILSRFSKDGKTCCTWLSPLDKKPFEDIEHPLL